MLGELRKNFAAEIRERYEHRAKSCLTCRTPGDCCLDEHFVNVHISRLEAAAINDRLAELPAEIRTRVETRRVDAISKYGLTSEGDTFARTFACPLFEKDAGCLVHREAKPLPCIHHACYDDAAAMPPVELLWDAEIKVDELNGRTYSSPQPLLPIPLALGRRP